MRADAINGRLHNMTQCANLFTHMRDIGPVTPLEAFRLYGILACHSRISELRERGIPVVCTMIRVGNKQVGQYSIGLNSDVNPIAM